MAFGFDDFLGAVGTAGASTLFKGLANNYASDRDWSRNAAMNWQMWEANNEYNHPKNVMSRYRAAGLNPNLIYGQMPQASQPAAVHSSTKPVDVDINWMLANQVENSELTNDLTREEIQNKVEQHSINDAAFAETLARTKLTNKRTELEDAYYKDRHAFNEAQIRNLDAKREEVDLAAKFMNYEISGDNAVRGAIKSLASKAGINLDDGQAEAIRRLAGSAGELGSEVFKMYMGSKIKSVFQPKSLFKPKSWFK